ncbi:MAG: septum formation protein Maf [Betaproteobacteria bacterium]|nr:septum formation protein Maf [Betaproteobacteria bacterium]
MLRKIVLASTSRYRADLLDRLGMPYNVASPATVETPNADEHPRDLALRLSAAKANSVASQFPDALIIGSDQVADCNGLTLGKPGSRERAIEQLQRMSGSQVTFHSGIALLDTRTATIQSASIPTSVTFRILAGDEIEAYVDREPAFDCAGSAKIEGLGIALMQSVRSEDPTALIGLPLIALTRMLGDFGVRVLGPH